MPPRLIELSHQIRHGMITYPGLPGPELSDYLPRDASPARYGPGTDVAGWAVLIHTGWDRYWGTERYGAGHPFLTAAAAHYLVEQHAALVGIDSVNIDDNSGPSRPVHTALLAAGIPHRGTPVRA